MIAGQPCPSAPDVEAVLTRRNTRCPAESDGESRCRFEPAAIGNFLDCRPPFRRASFCKQCLGARVTAFSGKLGQCVPGGRPEHQIGRSSCRSSRCKVVSITVSAFLLKKNYILPHSIHHYYNLNQHS